MQRAEPQDGSRCQKLWTSWQTSRSCWGRRSMKRLICSLWKNKDSPVKMQTFDFLICCIWGQRWCRDSGCRGTPQGCPVIILGLPSKHQFLNAGVMVLWWTVEQCSAITGYTCSQRSDKCWQVPEIISQSLRTDTNRDVCEECAALGTSASHKITSLIHSRCWCAVNGADFMIT